MKRTEGNKERTVIYQSTESSNTTKCNILKQTEKKIPLYMCVATYTLEHFPIHYVLLFS